MKKAKKSKVEERIKWLEDKALAECWEYCYENGLTAKERAEYNRLVYGE